MWIELGPYQTEAAVPASDGEFEGEGYINGTVNQLYNTMQPQLHFYFFPALRLCFIFSRSICFSS